MKNVINFSSSIVPFESPFCVSVSGGVDSISALYFLRKRATCAFHFNHKLRPQNDLMEESVRKFCDKFNIDLIVCDANDYPIDYKYGLEHGARMSRYTALKNTISLPTVVCQHLNDCVESYLMKTLEGKKYKYLMPPITLWDSFIPVIRPFLLTRKEAFRSYCQKNNLIEFIVEDETNYTKEGRRNFIRNKLLPVVEEEFNGLETIVSKIIYKNYEESILEYKDEIERWSYVF